MNRKYPIRPHAHNLEEISERFLEQTLPRNWTAEKPEADYGVDLRVHIFESEYAKGLELLLQLKASVRSTESENEQMRLSTATYNHLWDKLQVVMLVKYVAEDSEAYWVLLADVPEPNQEQKTFTVSIPKTNTLSNINWHFIEDYVRQVTDGKLAARPKNKLKLQQ